METNTNIKIANSDERFQIKEEMVDNQNAAFCCCLKREKQNY